MFGRYTEFFDAIIFFWVPPQPVVVPLLHTHNLNELLFSKYAESYSRVQMKTTYLEEPQVGGHDLLSFVLQNATQKESDWESTRRNSTGKELSEHQCSTGSV